MCLNIMVSNADPVDTPGVLAIDHLGDRWVFVVAPHGSTDTIYSGTTFPSVLKSSGKFELYNISSNPDTYMKSTEVKIDDPRNKYLKGGQIK